MTKTVDGFYIGDNGGTVRFRYRGDDGSAREVSWRCPPGRLMDFGASPPTKVRLTVEAGEVVDVEILDD